MDLHVLRPPESENHIFSVWSYVCVSVCVSVISISQKQMTADSSNLAFYICIIGRYCLKLFIKIGQKSVYSGAQKKSNTLQPMGGISR